MLNHHSNQHYSSNRKIDPTRRKNKPDGTPIDNNRVEIGPTNLAFSEWQKAGLEVPHLPTMREQRLNRLVEQINQRKLAGVLLFDPLNIRYASDTTNMQLWNTHNPYRACFVSNQGYMILWDFYGEMHSSYNPLVKEVRTGATFFYFSCGDGSKEDAQLFAKQIKELLKEHGDGLPLAIDKIMPQGYQAMMDVNIQIIDGEEVMEKTRSIKQSEEIKAMKCACYSCEQGMWAMYKQLQSGMSENDIWAVLHAENIKRGGEWIETRLLASGQRTNPWYHECGPRIMAAGELMAFDTDMVGCYGMCVDVSRTWVVDGVEPTQQQKELYTEAHTHINENAKLLKPGTPFKDLTFKGHHLQEKYIKQRYCVKMHGVGLCDEWPSIVYPEDYKPNRFENELQPGMIFTVEAYVGEVGGTEGVKLEDKYLITEKGSEKLCHFPFEENMIL